MGKMEKTRNRCLEFIYSYVTDRPNNYDDIKQSLIEKLDLLGKSNIVTSRDIAKYIYNLPHEKPWKRKHIYLLVRELINHYLDYDGITDLLFDIETGIIGDCATNYMEKYQGEPQDNDEFRRYIRSFEWL